MKDPISNGNIFIDDDRTGTTVPVLKRALLENLFYVVGKWPDAATDKDHFMALAYTVRDRILARWLTTKEDSSSTTSAPCTTSPPNS
jgi:starch phosphorylase